jgi:YHS domain-containing protein
MNTYGNKTKNTQMESTEIYCALKMPWSLRESKKQLEDKLKISFAEHDSLFMGGTYYLYQCGSERYQLFKNKDKRSPSGYVQPKYNTAKILLTVSTTNSELIKRLTTIGATPLT